MKRLSIALILVVIVTLTAAWFGTLQAQAPQRGGATAAPANAAPAEPTPRMPDGKPDLSGVWWGGADVGPRLPRGARGPTFQSLYQPWAADKAKTLSDKDDPTLKCIPVAFGTLNVSMYNVGAVAQIVQNSKFVVMLSETFHGFQLIPTDGRPHREDIPPAYRGDSVGRWEGDVFVVDTKNFTDNTWMSAEGRVSFHSDELHVVERYHRINKNTLEIEARVEDPKVLTGPWIVPKQTLVLAPFDQIMALNCSGTETQAAIGIK
jgi:hypothetical protein